MLNSSLLKEQWIFTVVRTIKTNLLQNGSDCLGEGREVPPNEVREKPIGEAGASDDGQRGSCHRVEGEEGTAGASHSPTGSRSTGRWQRGSLMIGCLLCVRHFFIFVLERFFGFHQSY